MMKVLSESSNDQVWGTLVNFFHDVHIKPTAEHVITYMANYFSKEELEKFLEYCYKESGISEEELEDLWDL